MTPAKLRELAATRLLCAAPETWNRSDDDMNTKARMIPEGVVPKLASVLVPIVQRGEDLSVILTKRTAHLSNHAGQIAFPGGRCDDGETSLAAALREAQEETGLAPSFVEPLGFLDGYLTVTGYMVTPVVALVRDGFVLAPEPGEVDEVFEVPFAFLMNAANRETHTRDWQGHKRQYYAYPFGGRYIWGATAGMIKNLDDRLQGNGA